MASLGAAVTLAPTLTPRIVASAPPWRVDDLSASSFVSSLPRVRARGAANFVPNGRRHSGFNGSDFDVEIDRADARIVSLVHRASHLVDCVFRFDAPVLDAVLAHFPRRTRDRQTARDRRRRRRIDPLVVCILSRADCISVYAPTGESYEVALPFHADRIVAMAPTLGGGVLLQRRPLTTAPSAAAVAAAFSPSHARSPLGSMRSVPPPPPIVVRPRYFTLAHPLEEVKPVALSSSGFYRPQTQQLQFLSDPALDLVSVCALSLRGEVYDVTDDEAPTAPRALLVYHHRHERRFVVYDMTRHVPDAIAGEDSTMDAPSSTSSSSSFVSPAKARQHQREAVVMEQYFKSHIVPDFSVQRVWTTPSLDALADAPASSVMPRDRRCQHAFVLAGSNDDDDGDAGFSTHGEISHRLCIVHEQLGFLLLKPLRANAGDDYDTQLFHDREDDLHVIRSHSAAPLALDDKSTTATDMVFSARGSAKLFLYSAGHVVAEVQVPDLRADSPVRLCPSDQFESFTLTVGARHGRAERRRYSHPLRVEGSSVLRSTFEVLEYAMTKKDYIKLHVATQALATTRYNVPGPLHRVEFMDDVEWWAFQCVARSTVRRLFGWLSDESHEHGAPKKPRATLHQEGSGHDGEADLIKRVLGSEFATNYELQHSSVLAALVDSPIMTSSDRASLKRDEELEGGVELSADAVGRMLTALHLLHEDLRLSAARGKDSVSIARLLHELCTLAGLHPLASYYSCQYACISSSALAQHDASKSLQINTPLYFDDDPGVPDVYPWLRERLQGSSSNGRSLGGVASFAPVTSHVSSPPFPRLQGVYDWKQAYQRTNISYPLWRTDAVCRVYELLIPADDDDDDMHGKSTYDISRLTELMEYLTVDDVGRRLSLEDLPIGIRFVLLEAIRVYREDPPHDVSELVCEFIGRRDLTGKYSSADDELSTAVGSTTSGSLIESTRLKAGASKPTLDSELGTREVSDGLSDVVVRSQRLFPSDQRLKEVARLLRSNRMLCLRVEKSSDMTDEDFKAHEQARLLLLCKRSMALSVARGMVTFGTFDMTTVQNQAWQLSVPALPLAGRTPPTNATVQLDVTGYAKELTHWPQFHNGCATGLRLPGKDLSRIVTRYWIKYHRPSTSDFQRPTGSGARTSGNQQSSTATAKDIDEAHAAHAGVLLGLGLNGHLKCLSMADVYNYLSISNEFVTVAILLGMATTAARSRRKRTSSSSAALQAARRRRRRERFPNTAPDPMTQDEGQLPTASQVADTDVDMEVNVPASAAQDSETPSDDGPTKTPLAEAAGAELSLERSVSKMLCLHIPALLPPAIAEFSVPASTQTAALLGLGILYQGSGHRLMTELLLTEITRSPASPQFVSSQNSTSSTPTTSSSTRLDQHEGYSLAAGLALGLVLLGRGGATAGDPGLSDIGLEEKLYKYIVGGATQPFSAGAGDSNTSSSCLYRGRKWKPFGSGMSNTSRRNGRGVNGSSSGSRCGDSVKQATDRSSWRGEHINIGVTACGSALALAFMYIKSGNRSIASQLAVPDTLSLLDYVRPDILLIRTLAKNLILWDSIESAAAWIEKVQVPLQLREAYDLLSDQNGEADAASMLPDHADVRSICESYANIVAGACFSMGLRFAGTSDASARETLRRFVVHFRDMRSRSALLTNDIVAAATDRVTIERCLSVCAQALALVDAGTGNLESLTLLRSINLRQRVDNELTYGNYMALSMAIGLLFLGGGRAAVSRSNDAIAALVVALYPMGAMNTADNKYFLQAFRHLYTLAADSSRYVETIDTTLGEPCSVELQVESHRETPNGSSVKTTTTFKTPCLLPEMDSVDRIAISTPGFYLVDIRLQDRGDEDGDVADMWTSGRSRSRARTTANDNRVKLLLEKSRILLERRAETPHSTLTTSLSPLKTTGNVKHYEFQAYHDYVASSTSANREVGDDGASAWWHHRLGEQLVPLGTSPSSLLPTHLNVLYEVFSMRHPRRRLDSLVGLWNLKLIHEFHRMNPFRSLGQCQSLDDDGAKRDFVEWIQGQTEEALRHRWRHDASVSFPSLSAVHEALEGSGSHAMLASSTQQDALLLLALSVFFDAPPSVYNNPSDWKRRIQHAMATASNTRAGASSAFAVDRFLLQQDHVTPQEQTFWLRIVSCFLFSV